MEPTLGYFSGKRKNSQFQWYSFLSEAGNEIKRRLPLS
jgi:hypothetical protein